MHAGGAHRTRKFHLVVLDVLALDHGNSHPDAKVQEADNDDWVKATAQGGGLGDKLVRDSRVEEPVDHAFRRKVLQAGVVFLHQVGHW